MLKCSILMPLSVLFKMCLCLCSLRTALILGCEYACKDAVDVLLKHGADVTAVDGFGHDSYHYARLSKNQELVSLVKSYLDSATKGFVCAFCFYTSLSHVYYGRAVLKNINWKELKCTSNWIGQTLFKITNDIYWFGKCMNDKSNVICKDIEQTLDQISY